MERTPPVEARFFFTSPLAIDDPLSPVPPPNTSSSTPSRLPPRPFSEYDNARLDEAWLQLRRNIRKHNEEQEAGSLSREPSVASTGTVIKTRQSSKSRNGSVVRQPLADASWRSDASDTRHSSELPSKAQRPSRLSPEIGRDSRFEDRGGEHAATGIDSVLLSAENDLPDTTGNPFVRIPSRSNVGRESGARDYSTSRPRPHVQDSYEWDDRLEPEGVIDAPTKKVAQGPSTKVPVGVSRLHQVAMPDLNLEPIYWAPVNDIAPVVRATWFYKETMMPVEVSVANMLELGYTEMQVWTQTWQDELNSAVEVGAVGEERILRKLWPDAQSKVSNSRPSTARGETTSMIQDLGELEAETPEKLRTEATLRACASIEAASGPDGPDNRSSGTVTFGRNGVIRTYATAGIIYEDSTAAHILKPNLQPSSYYGRRPLANYIRKGRKLGIAVVRGFDQAAWDAIYPPPKSAKAAKAKAGASTSEIGESTESRKDKDPQLRLALTPKVTDLVLVIHGIGQKLSERMESFHFTHAMNGFRREVNVELGSSTVRHHLREDAGGIMILPVNWRHTLSFEEGGYRAEGDDLGQNQYGLKDITPETLPSVRNIVSDVMLDIPYYLSHHQPKMIAAVIHEANRVYKLWCTNNPDFAANGRVHIIAHSLGSVMATDVLSNQPTNVPSSLRDPAAMDLTGLDHFAFNVTNLFTAGSPAGFFLLLKRAILRPRIDRRRAGSDDEALTPAICGQRGEYGCIAVDNIFNIINPYDPVSYRLNAAVDKDYAATLRTAWIPSATPGWFSSYTSSASSTDVDPSNGAGWFSSKPRKLAPVTSKAGALASTVALASATDVPDAPSTPSALPRLPSNVELETHDFTREEIAEKRMYLLNDTGQIDFMIKYGGGPLEIQYLTMLSAHSSYWVLKDFVRMIVLECGRKPGREGVVRGMKAVKKKAL